MKKAIIILMLLSHVVFSQTPQSFKYQAVVRDAGGVLSVNKIVSIKTSILSGSATGTSVYSEKQTLSTNDYGVVSLNIGAGTLVSGNFSTINWGANTYFVKTELDITGGSTYVFMGTSQILSVPYALYAEKTGSSLSDHDTSATNEIQAISITTNTLTLSKSGGNVNLTPYLDNTDSQTLSLVGNSLQISGGNAVNITGAVDLDADPTNELQTLSITTNTISLSNGNSISLNDNDATNELQTLSLNQGSLKISSKNTVNLPDSSAINELQTLSITQGSLKISSKNTIHLPDSSATNEIQTLTVTSDSIKLSKGGGAVKIPTPTNAIVPQNNCINSTSITPPSGYTFSGNNYLIRNEKWNHLKDTAITNYRDCGQCSFGNKIYCMGGFDGASHNYNLEFDPLTNKWKTLTSMPTIRSKPMLVVLNNKIYAIAGGVAVNEEFNPALNTWATKASPPLANFSESDASIIAYNNKIFIFGVGQTSALVYDPSSDNWSTYALPSNRGVIKTIIFNNLIYLLAGNGNANSGKTVETFNPVTNTFSTVASLNNDMGTHCDAFVYNNKLYAVGGTNIEEYNLSNNSWTVIKDFSGSGLYTTSYNSSNCAVISKQVFLITGDDIPTLFDFNIMNYTSLKTFPSSSTNKNHRSLYFINGKYYITGFTLLPNGNFNGIQVSEFVLPSVYYIHCAN